MSGIQDIIKAGIAKSLANTAAAKDTTNTGIGLTIADTASAVSNAVPTAIASPVAAAPAADTGTTAKDDSALPPVKKDNTLLYAGIGVFVIIVGSILYFKLRR